MIHFDLPKQKSSIMKVLGVGGGGSNAVNYMYADNIEGTDFIICNTDAKALDQSPVPNKVQLGPHLTQGLGAGADPEVGKHATEESLEEIRRILEVNTKMAFICAGMGGGTGTGGAPIIAQVCREMNILTVGIVTTPFGFEGPRRLLQAEEGIKRLQPYVDTLLIISNDKLRMQYGNLKMKEAFSKADNVLATAAKCITDIINSRGHIIVDFADVCTVMKNGGVAILGSAAVEGESRAQRAIEEALNSPLLNDNDIKGAKWILININSAEGDFECTMDELEIINSYLRMQAGEKTDVIVGMGYDSSLERKIGITLIATGFEQRDPVAALHQETMPAKKMEKVKEEKIVMTLGVDGEEKKMYNQQPLPFVEKKDKYAPTLKNAVEDFTPEPLGFASEIIMAEKKSEPIIFDLEIPEIKNEEKLPEVKEPEIKEEELSVLNILYEEKIIEETNDKPSFLNKPSTIYAQQN
jgi:cell division protein FtsZ